MAPPALLEADAETLPGLTLETLLCLSSASDFLFNDGSTPSLAAGAARRDNKDIVQDNVTIDWLVLLQKLKPTMVDQLDTAPPPPPDNPVCKIILA